MPTTEISTNYWLIAHRGASAFAPENTLPAMSLAKKLAAKWVEFDVVLSKDEELFVFHDEKLDRTSNGRGYIAKTTSATLRQLDAGGWYATEYQHTPIPTLNMMLTHLANLEMGMNLEIKPADDRIELLVHGIFNAIQKYWSPTLPIPLISSFSIEALRYARTRSQHARLGLLLHEWHDDWQKIADELNCYSVHLNKQIVTSERINAIRSTDRKVLCYTINNARQAKQLFEMGIDGIFSDYPNLLEKMHAI